ncbi:MAG: DUF4168 domain-containing protein [Gammaproteobacteria bacterium]
MKKFSLFGLLATILLLSPGLAAAQSPDTQTQDTRTAAPPRVNATELSEFAAAYGEVTQIRKRLMIKTHGMTDDAKIAALKAQAKKKMKQAIEAHMTLSEYVRIGNAVNANSALHARFMKMRQAARTAPAATAGG